VPKLIDDVVQAGGKGVLNAHGFYKYTSEEAQMWKETFEEFSYEIRRLALKYPADIVDRKLAAKKGTQSVH
jgi:3-hydroxybutyryl-CoA dehydrogenase